MGQSSPRSVVVQADGGSRGNPGRAAYGAVLTDAETGQVLAERAECIGTATNNVAEYRGLVAGLELVAEHAPEAEVEVRMDSKLVVEQMSGRWRIKHADMKPLAARAAGLAPFGTTYTWVPREQNKHADRLLNEALDAAGGGPPAGSDRPGSRSGTGRRSGTRAGNAPRDQAGTGAGDLQSVAGPAPERERARARYQGWSASGTPTTMLLVRHGVTAHTEAKRFSSGVGGSDPGLTDEGRAQVRVTGDWMAPLATDIDTVVTSPVRRTRESADILAERLGRQVREDPGLAEMGFGAWDGMTFDEVREAHPDDLEAWLGSLEHTPGGGESFTQVQRRVHESVDRLVAAYAGRTLVVVSHVTPIKVLVARTLGAPLSAVYRMELAPASVTVLSFFADGNASMRLFNARPPESAFLVG